MFFQKARMTGRLSVVAAGAIESMLRGLEAFEDIELKSSRAKKMKRHLILVVLLGVALAIYGIDHGIYIGTTTFTQEGIISKNCRYLFVTGVSEIPSRNGRTDNIPMMRGRRLQDWPDNLYCRFFAE